MALALQELAGNLPEIGTLTVTPDLLTDLLARLANQGDHEPSTARAQRDPRSRGRCVVPPARPELRASWSPTTAPVSRRRSSSAPGAASLDEVVARHDAQASAQQLTTAAIPADWRRAAVERADLGRFVFGPEDVVVVVGQDGLVANVAKYLDGQPVVGIDPEPGRNPGVLVRPPGARRRGRCWPRPRCPSRRSRSARWSRPSPTTARSSVALNEVYVGHAATSRPATSCSVPEGTDEHQSSSAASSSGPAPAPPAGAARPGRSATATCRSPTHRPGAGWFVREAWPSPATGTDLTEGLVAPGATLTVVAESDLLVCFGDGIETDALRLTWGQRLTVARSDERLRLVG